MAIPEQCPDQKDCGYITWRRNKPDPNMADFDGTCFRCNSYKDCPRYRFLHERNPETKVLMAKIFRVENPYKHPLSLNDAEGAEGYPPIDIKNGKAKRLIGETNL